MKNEFKGFKHLRNANRSIWYTAFEDWEAHAANNGYVLTLDRTRSKLDYNATSGGSVFGEWRDKGFAFGKFWVGVGYFDARPRNGFIARIKELFD